MKHINLLMAMLLTFSMTAAAFEFNSTNAPYDFTQTVEIHVLDKKGSKFFGMIDPFEIKRTTMPSRFYIAVLGVIERGHRNAEGVSLVDGAVSDYTYVVMFTSLDRSHVLLVGENWIVDGNKRIILSSKEISEIVDILKVRSNELQSGDLSNLESFFKQIDEQQGDVAENATEANDAELKSISEARKSIQARLPAGYNDLQNLPYYNKALENEQFREEQERLKKAQDEKKSLDTKLNEKNETTQPVITPAVSSPPAVNEQENKQSVIAPDAAPAHPRSFLWLGTLAIVVVSLLYWRRKRRLY